MSLPEFPRHTNVSEIGTGGFADVYRARSEGHLDRWVAIKLFRLTLDDRHAARQFKDECSAITRLDANPDVLTVHDAAVLPDGRPYLVMELCEGSLLHAVQQRGPLPPSEVATVGLRIVTALDAAHFARVLHGDVTPQNVLFRRTGAPALADFGLAVLRDHRGNTASGFNLAHAAPETVRHDGTIDELSDVYGLGSTMFHALTGHPPFPARLGENDAARAKRILHDAPPRPAGAPAWLADLVERMLAKDRGQRPATSEIMTVLAREGSSAAVHDIPVYGPPDGYEPAAPRLATGDADPMFGALTEERSEPVGKRRRPWVVPALVALVVGGGLGVAAATGVFGSSGGAAGPVPPTDDGTSAIRLDVPRDDGDGVTLTWTVGRTLADVGVVVAREGDEPTVQRLPREDGDVATTTTVPTDPLARYCFQIQGYETNGAFYESNVQPVRGAVCRFDPA